MGALHSLGLHPPCQDGMCWLSWVEPRPKSRVPAANGGAQEVDLPTLQASSVGTEPYVFFSPSSAMAFAAAFTSASCSLAAFVRA